ncbi:DsrE/DsrF/DrsH-like family protein [Thermicanus aegyptius]|uniref:DsrE/DsrF/DrsH-like family protein n=1 Tax=Thermicanus aegyptius TaxID=94009 RepID=UPI000346AA87|nr:DsrE/DsrF/DrsH-like family protein [Thermicanus aegyptius]
MEKYLKKEEGLMEQQAPKLSIILLSEELEKVHAAALVGSVAAMSGMEVNFFVTMNGLVPFLKESVASKNFKTGTVGKALVEKAQPFYELIENGKEMGNLKVYACALAMDVKGWKKEDLIDLFDDVIGVTAFFGISQGGMIITM